MIKIAELTKEYNIPGKVKGSCSGRSGCGNPQGTVCCDYGAFRLEVNLL